ncbi:MAG: PP2C family protein-serine/threonine phosphatase, partial [Thiohalospira sp.]
LEPYLIGGDPNQPVRGRINVNYAPRDVLLAADEDVSEATIDAALSTREAQTELYPGTMAWLLEAIPDAIVQLDDDVTARGTHFSADIVAASGDGRAYRRTRIVVNSSAAEPAVVFRRDLTDGGWPLDPELLAALRRGASPAEAAEEANAAVLAEGERDPGRLGMATTLVAVRLSPGAVEYAHVGDSRLYRFRDGALHALTRDHNAAADAVDAGRVEPAAARLSPLRHQLTRALGAPGVAADAGRAPLEPGDTLLLATDGLHGAVEEADIAETLARHPAEPPAAARALVAAANAAGGPDNVAVVVVQWRD